MTANASPSSVSPAARRPEPLQVDLTAAGLLAGAPAAFLAGRDRDLLAPLRFLAPWEAPGTVPAGAPRPLYPEARRELAAALAVANRGYGHADADRLARRLADPATHVVVTGQQPGLLGGPLYAFSKAVAAARWVAALEAQGEPAVAVFWVATEDHDWAEVSAAVVPTPEGARSFDLGPDPAPLTPLGMRTFGPAVDDVLRGIAEAVPGDLYGEWIATVGRWYRPDARFGEAFSRLMVHLLGPHSPLFLLSRGERRRIEWRGDDRWALRGREEGDGGSIADLLAIVDDNPGVVSPGVLARSAVQDAVLGTSLFLVGPGELAYMTQGSAVYPFLAGEAPWIALRPQALVLESHLADKLAGLGLSLADLLGDRHRLDRALAVAEGEDFVAPVRQRVAAALDELRAPTLAADPSLERPLDKTREQILRALDLFAEKAVSAAARRNAVRDRRVQHLREACLPLGRLQERVVAAAHFQGKYGPRFVASFQEQMELDPRYLQVISP